MAKIINLDNGKKTEEDVESCDDCGWTMFTFKIYNDDQYCTVEMKYSKCGEVYNLIVPVEV